MRSTDAIYAPVKKIKLNLSFFSRTTGPISTELGTKHPLVTVVQFVQMNDEIFKIFLSRTSGSISTKLYPKRPWVMGIQV